MTLREAVEAACDELRRLMATVCDEDYESIGNVLVNCDAALSEPDPVAEAAEILDSIIKRGVIHHQDVTRVNDWLAKHGGGQ